MKKLTFILFLLPAITQAQTLHVSPTSVGFWGQTPAVSSASIAYGDLEVVYLFARRSMKDNQGAIMQGGYPGVFWNPVNVEWKRLQARGGAGYLFRKFPTIHGANVNFSAKLTFKLNDCFGIRYSHMSNGFGIFNQLNPGIDSIGIEVKL